MFFENIKDFESSGYLLSVCAKQETSRQKVKPQWQIDVCVAVPGHRRGGGQV